MKIQYLGTAAAEAWPGIFCNCEFCKKAKQNGGKDFRTRSQAVIDDKIVMDFPQDSYAHMKDYGLDLPHINTILFTHTHQDHFYLEDLGLRFNVFCHDISGELTLYGNDAVCKKFDEMYKKDPADKHLDGFLRAQYLQPYKTICIEGYNVTPMLASHDKSENCYIYIVEKDGKSIFYGNDTGIFPEKTWEFLSGKHFDLVSLDCTHQKYKEGTNHLGIPDVLYIKDKFIQMQCADEKTKFVITHFSHNGHMLHAELEKEVAPYGILTAYDGFTVEF